MVVNKAAISTEELSLIVQKAFVKVESGNVFREGT